MPDTENEVHDSTGNVFADMDMPDADARLARYEEKRAENAARTLNQRAHEVVSAANTLTAERLHHLVLRQLREAASDQRHLCAEAVPTLGAATNVDPNPLEAHAQALSAAHAAVLNAPEPGA